MVSIHHGVTEATEKGLFCLSGDTDKQKGSSGESVVNPEPRVVRGISRFSRNYLLLHDLRASSESSPIEGERAVRKWIFV